MDKTLLKGLQVLELVTSSDQNLRITDVARMLKMTKSNAYRLLRSLEAAGYVSQNIVTKEFASSLKIWELGMQVIRRFDFRARAGGTLRDLADRSRETVHLAILDGREVIYIDKVDSLEPVAAYTRLGGRAPAHCVATGKALLAELAEAELAPRLEGLVRHSPFTIVDPIKLRAEFRQIRAQGYAINRGEWRDSVWGIACPIKDAKDVVTAAVGVSGPRYRLDDVQRSDSLTAMVQTAAAQIGKLLM